ncbi:MAG: hypothetical protein ACEQSC_02425, partial [Candidatus Nanopelagicaceae bacterium]
MKIVFILKTDLQLILYPREFYERPQINALAAYLATEFAQVHERQEQISQTSQTRTLAPPTQRHLANTKLPPAAFILS